MIHFMKLYDKGQIGREKVFLNHLLGCNHAHQKYLLNSVYMQEVLESLHNVIP